MEDNKIEVTTEAELNADKKNEKKIMGMNKQQRKYLYNFLLIIVVTGLTLYFVLKDNFFDVIETLKTANVSYIFAMLGLITVGFLIEGAALTVLAKLYKRNYRFHQGTCNGMIGTFFSGITPFASGGQFAQVYTFSKQGVKVAHSASILVMSFIVFQVCLTLYGILAIIFGYNTVIVNMERFNLWGISLSPMALSFVGFVINSFVLLSLFVLSYSKTVHRIVLNGGINLFAKLKLIKHPEKKRNELNAQVASFRVELRRLQSNWPILLIIIVLVLMKMTIMYSIPFFSGLCLGVDMSGKYFSSLWSTSYLSMITSFIPLPGASGGAEAFFQLMFGNIFGSSAITASANLLWRGTTYYYGLLFGGLVTLFYRGSPHNEATKVSSKTFVDLQIVSFNERSLGEKNPHKIMEPLSAEQVENSFKKIRKDLIELPHSQDSLTRDVDALEKSFTDTLSFPVITPTLEKEMLEKKEDKKK